MKELGDETRALAGLCASLSLDVYLHMVEYFPPFLGADTNLYIGTFGGLQLVTVCR